jgi:Putative collagen-binding domain of a collagenase
VYDANTNVNFMFGGSHNLPSQFWFQVQNSEGAKGIAHLRKLIDSRPFMQLAPDQGLVTDALSGGAHIRAARGQGYAYVYSAEGRPFTVNMGRITGSQVKAYWFDPKNGKVTFVGRFANSGQRTFQPPVTPGRGSDMVLILDDAGANYPLPGAV